MAIEFGEQPAGVTSSVNISLTTLPQHTTHISVCPIVSCLHGLLCVLPSACWPLLAWCIHMVALNFTQLAEKRYLPWPLFVRDLTDVVPANSTARIHLLCTRLFFFFFCREYTYIGLSR